MVPVAGTQPTTKQADAPAPKPAIVQPKGETVELSKTAQARLLKHQGETVAQIALSLGLDAKTVNSYLGSTTAPKQSAPIAPQVKPAASTAPAAKQAAPQSISPAEEATESSAAKAAEMLQGGK